MVAVELLNILDTSFNNYFKSLEQFGYKKDSDVNKLLVVSYIEELLSGEMRVFVTEDDYRAIERAIYCLLGTSCLLPYPSFRGIDNTLFGITNTRSMPRFTEDTNIRVTELDNLRYTVSNSYN